MQSIVLYTENFDSVKIQHDFIKSFDFNNINECISFDNEGSKYAIRHRIINDFTLVLKPVSKSLKFDYLIDDNDKRDLFDVIQNFYTNIDSVRINYDNGNSEFFHLVWNIEDKYNNLYQKSFLVGDNLTISIKKENYEK